MKLERGLGGLMAWVCVLLVACGGGGGGGATGGSSGVGGGGSPVAPNPSPVVPSKVTPATVVEASAAGSTSINLVWTPALSSTATTGLRYEVHVSEQAGFTPSPSTLMFSGNDVFETRIGGLRAGTTYHVQVLASDPQQAQAISTAVSVATATTPGELRAGVSFKALDDASVSSIEAARVVLAAGAVVPRVGSYIASAQGSGFLRQVTGTTTLADGRTALATGPAALADVVSAGDLSSTMSFPAPQSDSAGLPGPRMRVLAAGSGRAATVERQWTDSRVTLATPAAADPTSFSFEGTLQLSNTVTVTLEPRLQYDFKLGLFGLEHAKVALLGSASLRQQIVVQAAAGAALVRTVQVIAPRTIIAVHFIGPVPLVYSGQFSADLKMEAQADAAVKGSITTTLNLDQIQLGLEYSGGEWSTQKQRATPTHSFEVRGDGDATLRVKTTLIPKLKLSLYGAVTAQVAATPRLSVGLSVHGESSALAGAASSRWMADYWLTEGSLSTAMDAHVMADPQILQRVLGVWPPGARADNLDTHQRLEVVPQTPIAGLPILGAAADYVARHPDYPNAVRIMRTYSEVPNPLFPLGPAVFLGFGAWTDVVVPDPVLEDAHVIRPNPAGAGADELWLEFAKPSTHRVRLGAHSTLGDAARQVVEIEVVSKQYAVWSELSVITNVQRISAGYTTHTVAISGRVKGPRGALMGVSPYFGYVSDGSFVGLPVARNCGSWTMVPSIPDRDSGGLGCTRGENDPEETAFTLNGYNWLREGGGAVQTSRDQVTFYASCDSMLVAQRSCPVLGNIYNKAVVDRVITLLW